MGEHDHLARARGLLQRPGQAVDAGGVHGLHRVVDHHEPERAFGQGGAWQEQAEAVVRIRIRSAFGLRCIPTGCVAPPLHMRHMLGRRALPFGRIATLGARANPDPDHSRVQFAMAHQAQGGTDDVQPVARFQCGPLRADLAADWKLADSNSEPEL